MDKELGIPETVGDKINKFRPLDKEARKSTVSVTKDNSQARPSQRDAQANYGNVHGNLEKGSTVNFEPFEGQA